MFKDKKTLTKTIVCYKNTDGAHLNKERVNNLISENL